MTYIYTKVVISQKNEYEIVQIKNIDKDFFIARDFNMNFVKIDEQKANILINEIKCNKSLITKNGFLYIKSERLEKFFNTNYNFPKYDRRDIVETLNSSTTYFYRVLGYCAYHKRYITKQQLIQKQCIVKNCNRLLRLKHSFWYEKELKTTLKKLKKFKVTI